MPCSACGHGSTNSKPPILILGQRNTKFNKKQFSKKEKKTVIQQSNFRRKSISRFNMFKKINYN